MVKYNIASYRDAEFILEKFTFNEGYLRNLVFYVTNDGVFADGLDYKGLKKEGHKIKGIAEKILKSRDKDKNKKSLDKKIEGDKQLNLF